MKTNVVFVVLLAALAAAPLLAPAKDAALAKGVAAALQSFVDKHALAGAVTLVADKDKVLSLEAVGFADIVPTMTAAHWLSPYIQGKWLTC
jgi:hypothetical protein